MHDIRRRIFILATFLILGFELVSGQTEQIWNGPSDVSANPRWATSADFDGSGLVFCRGYYSKSRHEEGFWGWYVDYPGADYNFLVRLAEFTKVRVRRDAYGRPVHVVVRLDEPLIFRCPVVFLSDVEAIELRESEVNNLRLYLEKGGFLWADDFWGSESWDNWEYQIRKVLPSGIYPMIDIPASHPIMRQLYYIPSIPQIPNYGLWMTDKTSEKDRDSEDVHFRGIEDENGRLMVISTHNTDIGETWEREAFDRNGQIFYKYSVIGYAIGINIFLYALSH